VIPKIPDRTTYTDFWRKRIGRPAAKYMWWSRMVIAVVPLMAVIFIGLTWLAVKAQSEYATALGWILGVPSMIFAVSAIVAHIWSRRLASRSLGIKISSKSFPPIEDESYLRWCRDRGLKPFTPANP